MSQHVTVTTTLGSSLADAGTTTFTLPTGYDASDIAESGHVLVVKNGNSYSDGSKSFTVSVSGSTVTLTNNIGSTIASGSVLYLQLGLKGTGDAARMAIPSALRPYVGNVQHVIVNLGAPSTAAANGYCASQDLTALGVASVNTTAAGAIAAASLAGASGALFGRNVVAAWTGTAVITVTGTDWLGNTIKESSGSGTSFTGKKAFKTVTNFSVSADVTGLTVGTGVVLGLPVYLPSLAHVTGEVMDGAKATAGTPVAGDLTKPSATTGDVRGTYTANTAPNGSHVYNLILAVEDQLQYSFGQYAG